MSERTIVKLEQVGDYRAIPAEWSVFESDSSESVAITINWKIVKQWDPGAKAFGDDWDVLAPEHEYRVLGNIWIIGKDGAVNKRGVKTLTECGLWDGKADIFELVASAPAPQAPCLVSVQEDTYGDQVRFQVAWVNPDSDAVRARGALTPTSPDAAKKLAARFGAKLRATVTGGGNAKAVAGAVPPPPPPAGSAAAEAQREEMGNALLGEDAGQEVEQEANEG